MWLGRENLVLVLVLCFHQESLRGDRRGEGVEEEEVGEEERCMVGHTGGAGVKDVR